MRSLWRASALAVLVAAFGLFGSAGPASADPGTLQGYTTFVIDTTCGHDQATSTTCYSLLDPIARV